MGHAHRSLLASAAILTFRSGICADIHAGQLVPPLHPKSHGFAQILPGQEHLPAQGLPVTLLRVWQGRHTCLWLHVAFLLSNPVSRSYLGLTPGTRGGGVTD